MRPVLGGVILAAAVLALAPVSAGAVVFGTDMSHNPTLSSCDNEIGMNVLKSDGTTAEPGSPVSGILMSVRIRTQGAGGSGVFRVIRQTAHPSSDEYDFLNVGPEIPVTVSADGSPAGHVTEVTTHQPIEAGDRISQWFSGDSGCAIQSAYDDGVTPSLCPALYSSGLSVTHPDTHTVGTTAAFRIFACNHPQLLSATVEADADHDGFGDETQDQCPTNASLQSPCPVTTPAHKKCKKKKHRSADAVVAKKCKKKRR